MANMNERRWDREDTHGSFLISTQLNLLDHAFINGAFSTDEMYWASPLPEDQLALTLSQSVTMGLYEVQPAAAPPATAEEPSSPRTPSPTLEASPQETLVQIGLARLITDHVTCAYLTDVYVSPTHRGLGLAKWLIACVRELLQAHPALRRALLFTGSAKLKDLYTSELGFHDMKDEGGGIIVMSRRAYTADGT